MKTNEICISFHTSADISFTRAACDDLCTNICECRFFFLVPFAYKKKEGDEVVLTLSDLRCSEDKAEVRGKGLLQPN